MLFITSNDPNALCRHCRTGSPHSLSIHAKTLLAIDSLIEEFEQPVPVTVSPSRAPKAPAVQRELAEVY